MITDQTTFAELKQMSITDVINALLKDRTISDAPIHRNGPMGNVWFRQINAFGPTSKAGAVHAGHCHRYDHVTNLYAGAVEVVAFKVDMKTQKEIEGTRVQRIYEAPAKIMIKKDMWHTITSLVDGTQAECIYAIRDDKGEVSQDWDGRMEPYL